MSAETSSPSSMPSRTISRKLTYAVPSYTLSSAVAAKTFSSFGSTVIAVLPSVFAYATSSGVKIHSALVTDVSSLCVPSFHASVP